MTMNLRLEMTLPSRYIHWKIHTVSTLSASKLTTSYRCVTDGESLNSYRPFIVTFRTPFSQTEVYVAEGGKLSSAQSFRGNKASHCTIYKGLINVTVRCFVLYNPQIRCDSSSQGSTHTRSVWSY